MQTIRTIRFSATARATNWLMLVRSSRLNRATASMSDSEQPPGVGWSEQSGAARNPGCGRDCDNARRHVPQPWGRAVRS